MSRTSNTSGFTLLELLLANAIAVLVIAVTTVLWHFVLQNFDFSMTQFRLTEDADLTVRQIQSELRQAQEAMQGAYPLAIVQDNELAFYADIDNNGTVERVRYWLDADTLKRGVVDPSGNPPQYDIATEKVKTVVSQVTAQTTPLFTYYNSNWPGDTVNNPLVLASRPIETRLIRVFIPIEYQNADGVSSHSAEVTVQLRNLNTNL